uniref:Mnd1 HTH domain-containing protein n=1 Tax=Brassica oleracea TaxID=3712 RepID=A0A3P6G4M0_BRAOL|nr:unnamed protein product [Brassica oleracea]
MLQIFYDSQDFFLSVKDVIQSLVDNDLVAKDKIGISVCFWSLPICAGNQLRSVLQKLEADHQGSNKRLAELVDQCEALNNGREETISISCVDDLHFCYSFQKQIYMFSFFLDYSG